MKSLGFFIFLSLAMVLVVSVSAQTSLSLWPYYVEVTPEKNSPGLYDLIVPLPVLDKSNQELGDLRLFDSTNREIPYAIRVRREAIFSFREEGQLSTWSVPVPPYQLERNQGANASAWNIDLGGRAPCDRLTLEVDDNSFSRPFQVEAIDDPQNARLIATGTLTRRPDETKPLVIVFDDEEMVRKIRLQITDHSNPTLNITSIQASAPARQLVFELKQPVTEPLRLFFGSPNVSAPHYDFENELQKQLSTEPAHSRIGNVITNPAYKPEPLPLTERVPWLIYVVLAASSIALGFILFSLARTATRIGGQPVD